MYIMSETTLLCMSTQMVPMKALTVFWSSTMNGCEREEVRRQTDQFACETDVNRRRENAERNESEEKTGRRKTRERKASKAKNRQAEREKKQEAISVS